MFAGTVSSKGGLDGLLAIILGLLLDLDDGVKPRATTGIDVDIEAAHDLIHLPKYRRLAGHTHKQLVLQPTWEQSLPDTISPVCDGIDNQHRLLADNVIGLSQIDERSLGVNPVEIYRALDDDL